MTHPRHFFSILLVLLFTTAFAQAAKPNFILIFTDDQGYGDLSCYGSKTIRTPNIDRLAKEGRKFTSSVTASSVCTPSRAALLTASYPKRIGLQQHVLFPWSHKGLHPDEYTIADHLKAQGYATACYGKWHLGHDPEVLPTANGFDTYYGIPYSNDMNHPGSDKKSAGGVQGMDALWKDPESALTRWNTPLMENEKIVELPVDQRTVTRRYTQKAIDFARAHREQPFFIYLPHTMPHIPLYVPDDVRDPDPKNAYINVIEHLDAEVGRLLDALDELGLTKNTYVIFTTDNGPWLEFKHHGGSAGPLRGGKGMVFEGGHRVPFLIRGPGIPAGTVCNELMSTLDVLPTIATITRQPLPKERKIDGVDVSGLWSGRLKKSPREEFLYYSAQGNLRGLRQGEWKLLIKDEPAANKPNQPPATPKAQEFLLFNLEKDLAEKTNLADQHPDIVTRLQKRMEELDTEIINNTRAPWVKK